MKHHSRHKYFTTKKGMTTPLPRQTPRSSLHLMLIICLEVIILTVGFATGYLWRDHSATDQNRMNSLRLSGYRFIKPLLACDTEKEIESHTMHKLRESVASYIEQEKDAGHVKQASVYVRNYGDSSSLDINGDEKYYPASLNKIPLLITAYEMERMNHGLLEQRYLWDDSTDYNHGVMIQPSVALQPGQTYSIKEALDYLIKHSDNNAYFFLTKHLDGQIFQKSFHDLRIPTGENIVNRQDFMTAKEFSYFLRVLFNATYLNNELSEAALALLTEVNYIGGLVAGLPSDIKVAHKFGIAGETGDLQLTQELHDCGIIYTKNPYLICVMTKTESNFSDAQNVIKNISAMTYNELK